MAWPRSSPRIPSSGYYLALCHGVPDAADPRLRGIRGVSFEPGGMLKMTTQLARHRTDRQRQAVVFEGGRHAVTRARALERFGTPPVLALMECWLETGRTHQIRVHLAHVGPRSGRRSGLWRPAQACRGRAVARSRREAVSQSSRGRRCMPPSLGFDHPVTGEDMRFEAPLAPTTFAECV